MSFCLLFVTGEQTISHTQVRGGTKKLFVNWGQTFLTHSRRGGQTFFYKLGGANIFLIIMIIVENVSGASIMSSKARKQPAGSRMMCP